MARRSGNDDLADLESARVEFERWRETRQRGARIPSRLWSMAVQAVQAHGITRTIQTLSLDFYALKQRIEEERADAVDPLPAPCEPSFVELPMLPNKRSCTVELHGEGGEGVRVELQGLSAEEVVTIVRGLWSRER